MTHMQINTCNMQCDVSSSQRLQGYPAGIEASAGRQTVLVQCVMSL